MNLEIAFTISLILTLAAAAQNAFWWFRYEKGREHIHFWDWSVL